MSGPNVAGRGDRPAHLVLIEQSGAKQDIPQPSTRKAMIEAEHIVRRPRGHLREVKVIIWHRAVARWKADELGWRRVA